MKRSESGKEARSRGFLSSLALDVRGNTLAMMAIFLIPLSALAGSAVDMSRLYVVKVRLQQACDAGVLAGRKFMTSSASTTLDTTAAAQAQAFFKNNFTTNWMGVTTAAVFTPTKTADQQVAGTATVLVPMTIMKMFRSPSVTLNVACEARFDVGDSDIMFVLDTTGSMACAPADASCSQSNLSYTRNDGTTGYYVQEKSDSKLDALRDAVVDFDTTIRDSADPTTHIRYGFVTYSSSVNVGRLIPSAYMVNTTWNYQSRKLQGERSSGSSSSVTLTGYTSSTCTSSLNRRYPGLDATVRAGWNTDSTAYYLTGTSWSSSQSKCTANRQYYIPTWRYTSVPQDVSGYVASLTSGNAVVDPTRLDGRTIKWQGCIEERDTTASTSFDIDNLPGDLDPDLIPSNTATMWRPMWPAAVWDRSTANSSVYEDSYDTDAVRAAGSYKPYGEEYLTKLGYSACGAPASRLAVMSAADVSAYVNGNDFKPLGGTYHDIGMIWGVRMLSPNGVFAADTTAWPGRTQPNRHIVFMTDGQMSPVSSIYGQYGMEDFDRRVTGTTVGNDLANHTARFLAECKYAKERLNMTVWVVALGTTLNSDLKTCASDSSDVHAFTATSKTELAAAFKTIAQQVALLRISK